mgnify:CR=1 FL=1
MAIRIERVEEGSEAAVLGLAGGDELLSVDGNELNDTLDYDFYTDSKSFHLKARVADGIREWDVRREERGPFGCDFSTYLGDQKHSCSNHCMFCFIDQLPPGMRESLYFKDDDERLSFLFGNYITMTNMQDHEIDRIIKMHISPINISVHTTNPQLRVRMLANKRGGEVLKYLPRLVEGGIAVNCQLVLCRGINDGEELRRTLGDLLELMGKKNIRLIVNRVDKSMLGTVCLTIDDVMDTAGLPLLGIVLEDCHVTLAAAFGLPLLKYASRCEATRDFRRIAARLQGYHKPIPWR